MMTRLLRLAQKLGNVQDIEHYGFKKLSTKSTGYYPKMHIEDVLKEGRDEMHNVHGHALNLCRPSIMKSLDEIITAERSRDTNEPIRIADFGTADGRTSLRLINEIIGIIRCEFGLKKQIMVCYNDQVMNDFNVLCKVLKGDEGITGLAHDSNVYTALIPRSMYEQCLPDNNLHLSLSSIAVHYLSQKICTIKKGVFYEEADEDEKQLFEKQAQRDWTSFVISRGKELKPGGRLVVITVSSNDMDMTICQVQGGVKHLGVLLREMKDEGIITQEEYIMTTFNAHYKRKDHDFREPFLKSQPEVNELGLEIVSTRPIIHYLQHHTFDVTEKDKQMKQDYATQIVATLGPWMHHVIYGGLCTSRTEAEKQDIVDQFFERVFRYAYFHNEHKPYLVLTEIVIKRSNACTSLKTL